ncbi:precorrin-6A synthase (deacetylating) [Methylopila sp. Yamaguchi]|uniref:precorrin-6A synthase (deacetylating) n=1 Tax=Methylopila sp. Yamaguchi TaxID=1437817 RepID=UPI000CA6EF1E|nr:precorrin-6A synthase (deacetylating) [Methylopila sp. Yamaguchi]GBD48599.1 precorrin-6A synthase [Methylopila sp. Yamaguchi]
MAKTIKIIGIGAGDPDHLTLQAVKALNQVDAVFLMDKGPAKDKLIALRKEICRQHLTERPYRFIEAVSPERDRDGDYAGQVQDLNARKQEVFEQLIAGLSEGECGGFLVWGDPSLYDSTIRIVGAIADSGRHDIAWEVIPGISSIQALVAKHRTTLNRIGSPVEITTGRRLAAGLSQDVDSVVVMLDAEDAYEALAESDAFEIFWGAYVGTPDEILISGRLKAVAAEIARRRAEARAANGWIMDSYLLRRDEPKS